MRHWSGRTRWGLPGVHGFFAGNDWEFFRVLRPGDAVNCVERVHSDKLVIQYVETIYTNQRDEILARVVGWCTRHLRRAARERGKYADVPKRHEYTPQELDAIDQQVLNEKARGSLPRYWEETQVGEELIPVIRGPLSLQDVSAFLVGTGRSSAHGVLLREALRHPDHYFRNPEAGGGLEYTGIGHLRDSVAEAVGVPGAYDYGPQRVSWMGTLMTNWMGDEAFLKRLRVECRRFNVYGDTQWLKGKVVRKYLHNGSPLVDVDVRDIRRLVAQGRVVPDWENVNTLRRVLLGLQSVGIQRVVAMPDSSHLVERARDDPQLSMELCLLEMPAYLQ